MSYIPDCRTDEFYNEKYLNEKDAEFVRGFDWCCEMAADIFFDNLPFAEDSHLMHVLNEEIPEDTHEEYDIESEFDVPAQHRIVKTYADKLRALLLDFIESERDELIVSMIDGMDDAEYKAIKERVDNGRTAEENRQRTEED